MEPQIQNPELVKYTNIPILDPIHREKLDKFIQERGEITNKSSLCRFYLRGICIMKPQYCKFAHSVAELTDLNMEPQFHSLVTKEQKKKDLAKKRQFNQTALFILKNVPYKVLYDYQFSDRYQKSKIPHHSLQEISKQRTIRIRIREIMHRENWDGFIDFLEAKFPCTDYPVSFLSAWFARFGFDKPQTRCKFGDFLKYIMNVRKYYQVETILPPSTEYSIVFINSQKKQTLMQQNSQQIYQINLKRREKENQEKIESIENNEKITLPVQFNKKFMCRYYMAGNCHKSDEQCNYAHSIEILKKKHELEQIFPKQYRQIVMPLEYRLNYISLANFATTLPKYQEYSLEDINLNTNIRNQLREQSHLQLFTHFMQYLEKVLPNDHSLTLEQLKRYYNGAGFNHTNQNKFQHLENALWKLGYFAQDSHYKDPISLEKVKVTYVIKLPSMQKLDTYYKDKIEECLKAELENISENQQILESALRRTLYANHQKNTIPLHIYLRAKNQNLQQIIESFYPVELTKRIFFESGQQNYKKLGELIRKFTKKVKKYMTPIDDIEMYIKSQNKESININHFMNMRQMIQTNLLEMGKKIYYWPFDNNAFVLDKACFGSTGYAKQLESLKKGIEEEKKKQIIDEQEANQLKKYVERVTIVDNQESLDFAKKYLEKCAIVGVDLEGRLSKNGYIDLVQISGIRRNSEKKIINKQIFIFDIWLMNGPNKNENSEETKQMVSQEELRNKELFENAVCVLRQIFENPYKVKVLHDCRQDSTALKNLLNINIKTVFDTSGYDVYLNQQQVYSNEPNFKSKASYILRKIYDVKVPGLNTILDKYQAPNGVNIFKQSMKKRFGEQYNRSYFEERPIDPQFLEYSARDVEDLIEVYEKMTVNESEGLLFFIGNLYSRA